jgi:hypothetical protein
MIKVYMTFVVFLLIIKDSKAQYQFIKNEGDQLYFEKIYNLDSLSSINADETVFSGLTKVPYLTDISRNGNFLNAKFKDANIDYRKYGGKWSNTAAYLNHPFFADVSIFIKENKYKVVVNNMRFETNTSLFGTIKCNQIFISNGEFKKNKNIVNSGIYIEKHLDDCFNFKLVNPNW